MTREEAIKRFETLLLHVDTDCVMGMETTEAINLAIKALAQPEIVRCRDCKHYRALHDQDDLCVYTMTSVEADDYCSYAERKEGEAE